MSAVLNQPHEAAATVPVQAVRTRPARPPVDPLPVFEMLDEEHRAAMRMLGDFQTLLDQLESQGLDDAARAAARAILGFFSGPGRHHHAHEERHVFPGLLLSTDVTLVQQVRRLQQDHHWLEEDWRVLQPQIEAIANGYSWYELPMLRQALPVFQALYQEHIALEESLIYPAAKRQQKALQQADAARIAS